VESECFVFGLFGSRLGLWCTGFFSGHPADLGSWIFGYGYVPAYGFRLGLG
jgi:hypothetical protein